MAEELTSEAKMKAIIEAHLKGGYDYWKEFVNYKHGLDSEIKDREDAQWYVMNMLLDTVGAKAAYGEENVPLTSEDFLNIGSFHAPMDVECPRYCGVTIRIILAWHSEEGNNWKAAIDTAYSLLPETDA